MLKNLLFQMPTKATSMCRVQREISNKTSFTSNEHCMKMLSGYEVWKELEKKRDDVAYVLMTSC